MGERDEQKSGGVPAPSETAGPALVAGRYERVARLGSGAFGEVIRAHDRLLGRDVALKRVRLEAYAEPGQLEEVRQRFVREAQVAARLRHPGIVTTHDILNDQSGSYIVMELVEGRTLQSVILEQGQLSLEDSVAILSQVAAALDDAHAQGVVHRDVKPANVMIEPSGHVKVMDFGIAKLETGANLTSAGLILGTPNYMAPEQARGGKVDGRADVFSLGCILYECLSGQKPFRGETVTAILMKILTEETPPLNVAQLGLPSAVGDVVRRAMARDPERRYRSGTELVAALRTAGGLPATSVLSPSIAGGGAEPQVDGELELDPELDGERTAVSAGRSERPAETASPVSPARSHRALVAAALILAAGTGVLYATGVLRQTLAPPPPATGALVQRQEVGVVGRLLGRKPRLLVTVPARSSLSLSLTTPLTSETAEAGDSFEAVVREAVVVEGTEAIPAGTRARGHVSRAQPSGKGRGELTLELDRLTLEGGESLHVRAELLEFRGRSGARRDDKISGAIAGIGAAVGGLFGGKKGGATAAEKAVLAPGSKLSFELAEPARVTRPDGP